jgi:hypothetical protein
MLGIVVCLGPRACASPGLFVCACVRACVCPCFCLCMCALCAWVQKYFPDAVRLLPDLIQQYKEHPTGALVRAAPATSVVDAVSVHLCATSPAPPPVTLCVVCAGGHQGEPLELRGQDCADGGRRTRHRALLRAGEWCALLLPSIPLLVSPFVLCTNECIFWSTVTKRGFPSSLPTILPHSCALPSDVICIFHLRVSSACASTPPPLHCCTAALLQGMNCGFEDALVFKEILEETKDDLSKAVPIFAARRRPDADAISILSWYALSPFPRGPAACTRGSDRVACWFFTNSPHAHASHKHHESCVVCCVVVCCVVCCCVYVRPPGTTT